MADYIEMGVGGRRNRVSSMAKRAKRQVIERGVRGPDGAPVNKTIDLSRLKDSPVASETTRAARAKVDALDPRTRTAIRSTLKMFKKSGLKGP